MSIENITAKIISDATEYAEKITAEAKQEASNITAEAQKKAEDIKKHMAQRAHDESLTLRHRRTAVAELEARKIRLDAKQKAVAQAILAAIDHCAAMDQTKYVEFLAKKIAEVGVKEGQVILNAKDKEAIGKSLVEEANKLLSSGNLTLSEQTINAKGGFVIKSGSIEVNSSLETMINSLKEEITPEIVEALFPKHEDMYEKV